MKSFIGHNFGDYKNSKVAPITKFSVLSVTILETTKTANKDMLESHKFYRSQFWRLQKHLAYRTKSSNCFIGHNFGDYKNPMTSQLLGQFVLSVTILETTKTRALSIRLERRFYRSQFWRLQKLEQFDYVLSRGFIGHNFGDYKNLPRS